MGGNNTVFLFLLKMAEVNVSGIGSLFFRSHFVLPVGTSV